MFFAQISYEHVEIYVWNVFAHQNETHSQNVLQRVEIVMNLAKVKR